MRKAVILLSGGLDSTTVLVASSIRKSYKAYCLTFDYEQRHRVEIECASAIVKRYAEHIADHKVVRIDFSFFKSSSSLLDSDMEVPEFEERSSAVPSTYVPARNTIFLSYALAYAESVGAATIFIGANAVDYSNYPDCRPEYIEQFERLANLALARSEDGMTMSIVAPLLHLNKMEIVKLGLDNGLDYSITSSCYNPRADGAPCRKCDSCHFREEAFKKLDLVDPLVEKFYKYQF